ncbi:membrane-spanning protein [Actinomycetes bacterium NPDC127524]
MKNKLILILSLVFSLFMLILFIVYLIKDDSSRWQVALGGIAVSALPLFMLFVKKNPFSILIYISYYIFLFCTTCLGSILSFYMKYKWWDSTLHFYKGLFIGFIAISLYTFLVPLRSQRYVSKWIPFIFIFSLAVTASVIWEIYEFAGDRFFTHTMQRGGNRDTMYDLLCGTAGGLLTAIYFSIKTKKPG